VQVLFNSLVVSTLFFRTTLHPNSAQEGNFYLGVLFFSLIHIMCACYLVAIILRWCLFVQLVHLACQEKYVSAAHKQVFVGHSSLKHPRRLCSQKSYAWDSLQLQNPEIT